MSLPGLIEIVPLDHPVHAEINVPGSKSITNRALILAALAPDRVTLCNALWSEDTQVMASALARLGFKVQIDRDPLEECNRHITVQGCDGELSHGGTAREPLEVFVGNAGTAARFLAPFLCLGDGVYRLHGTPRMHERPQAALFQALRQLGYQIESPNDRLPALIHGAGPKRGRCRVSIEESSQFASGLLLCAKKGGWTIEVTGENAEESPYVAMTTKLIEAFPRHNATFEIEPDASSGSYFWGAQWLLYHSEMSQIVEQAAARHQQVAEIDLQAVTNISVARWPTSGWQIDAAVLNLILPNQPQAAPGRTSSPESPFRSREGQVGDSRELVLPKGGDISPGETTLPSYPVRLSLPDEISREDDLGDSIMTVAILAPFVGQIIRLTDLGRLRLQETERVCALRTELTRCGAQVVEQGNTLTIVPSRHPLHGAEIETYDDHRMAMCFAILGLKVPGIKIKNPGCVKKTFPNFFQKLAAYPPHGLGVTIRDPLSGRALTSEELFAG